MCGIVGYVGGRPARDVITKGLKRLEYRGYDSAGFAAVNGDLQIFKTKGRVSALEAMIPDAFARGKGAFAGVGGAAGSGSAAGRPGDPDLSGFGSGSGNTGAKSGNASVDPTTDHGAGSSASVVGTQSGTRGYSGTAQSDSSQPGTAAASPARDASGEGRELSIFEEDEFAHLRERPAAEGRGSHPDGVSAAAPASGRSGAGKGDVAGPVEPDLANVDLSHIDMRELPADFVPTVSSSALRRGEDAAVVARALAPDAATEILEDASRRPAGNGHPHPAYGVNILHPDSHFVNSSGTSPNGNAVWAALGHTRWATHGEPNDVNAHPHSGNDGAFALVHNGIIENYAALRTELERKGHVFASQTDTEVLAHLIEEIDAAIDEDFVTAVQQALSQVEGTYGIVIVHRDMPGTLIAARKGSPLLLGVGDGEFFVASDASPIIEYTQQVVYLDDEEMAVVTPDGYEVRTTRNVPIRKEVHQLAMDLEQIEKGGYEHFMLKEIFEQPRALADCMRGRLLVEEGRVQLGGLQPVMDKLLGARRILIAACGTSWHSALVGEYLIEALARIPVEVAYASEFRYSDPIIEPDDVLIVVSQSGETADTLAAMREAKSKGATVIGVVNVVGSTIARETDAGVYIHAGPEIGVASTKAFTAQVTVLTMIALHLAQHRGTLPQEEFAAIVRDLAAVPEKISEILEQNEAIASLSRTFTYAPNFLYLGRSYNFPVALEGALKLKEISYIHAEGYPAAEMKHGPIALIDEHMPVVVLATADHVNEKMTSNIEEVRARKGRIISVATPDNAGVAALSEFMITVPQCHDAVTPLLSVIPLQLLSYHIAVARKCNVDMPRNLAKSVTVE
ncbi:MAG: glutamine-fructose-6-phosphate transaminase (isomerizing) GlmS [Bacteroidetes bacterium HLUCCA01]|nr:MAG: glutamine-fructose-6-phosphate transaminase (isomerizing) GlmS [Bacteroidetes bacterium HLUCCA01]